MQSVGETRRTREKCGGTGSFGIGDIPEVLENAAPTVCARCPGSVQAPAALDHSHTHVNLRCIFVVVAEQHCTPEPSDLLRFVGFGNFLVGTRFAVTFSRLQSECRYHMSNH